MEGQSWDLPAGVPISFFTTEELTEKGVFAGTLAGYFRDTRPSRGFVETLCDLFGLSLLLRLPFIMDIVKIFGLYAFLNDPGPKKENRLELETQKLFFAGVYARRKEDRKTKVRKGRTWAIAARRLGGFV